jgi:hypothetical protein
MTGLAPGLFFGLAAHYAIDQFHTEMDSITREALATTRRMLEEIFTNSRALGMEPVLMSIPMAVHVSDTLFADTLAYYDLDPARYDRHQLGHELRSVAERQDVTFLDLQAELAKDADPASLFFPLDRHLNAAGHARVGEILGSALSSIALKREKE